MCSFLGTFAGGLEMAEEWRVGGERERESRARLSFLGVVSREEKLIGLEGSGLRLGGQFLLS